MAVRENETDSDQQGPFRGECDGSELGAIGNDSGAELESHGTPSYARWLNIQQ